jgi:hypothetical protein
MLFDLDTPQAEQPALKSPAHPRWVLWIAALMLREARGCQAPIDHWPIIRIISDDI